jgi:hypothetical protein
MSKTKIMSFRLLTDTEIMVTEFKYISLLTATSETGLLYFISL